MKKFTLTLVLLFIIAIAFGQRANKFAQFTKVSPYSMKKPIEAQNGEKGALNPIWTELFTDSGTVVVNGLPDDFSYTPNAIYTEFSFANAEIPILKKYDEGEVKEGVGAGASLAYANTNSLTNQDVLEAVELIMYTI